MYLSYDVFVVYDEREAVAARVGVPPLADDWRGTLSLAAEAYEASNDLPLIVWDEFTWMLKRIADDVGDDDAIDLLLHLQSIRLQRPRLKIVLAGSISIHTAVRKLRQLVAAKNPIHDLAEIVVPPLAPTDAFELATEIAAGEGLRTSDEGVERLVKQVHYRPYYIHEVLACCADDGLELSPAVVDAVVDRKLSTNAWDLKDDIDRIEEAFHDGELGCALALLDSLAHGSLVEDDLLDLAGC